LDLLILDSGSESLELPENLLLSVLLVRINDRDESSLDGSTREDALLELSTELFEIERVSAPCCSELVLSTLDLVRLVGLLFGGMLT
jgi:hypothetical protein